MSPLWVIVVFAVVGSSALLLLAVRRTHDEITPTIEAFDRFRAAISPSVTTLRAETDATRRKIAVASTQLGHRSTPPA
jgi:hypothetical protein